MTKCSFVAKVFLITLLVTFSPTLFVFGFKRHCCLRFDCRIDSRFMSKSQFSLDKTVFTNLVSLVALKIPAKLCTDYLRTFKEVVYNRPKIKRIYDVEGEPDKRFLLLNENYSSDTNALPESLREMLKENGITTEKYILKLGYDNLAVDEVLRKILPAQIAEIPSSFEQAGHVAHLNIRDEALEYRHVIGQVILDKNPSIKTVVNKVGNIETTFRTFPMEVIAGENNLEVTVKESGAVFKFNFEQVYWNSRLQGEHQRLIDIIVKSFSSVITPTPTTPTPTPTPTVRTVKGMISHQPVKNGNDNQKYQNRNKRPRLDSTSSSAVVVDMMAGVGPFAIPIAKNNIRVYANDLNPASYKSLVSNSQLNHCTSHLLPFNMDAREFILKLIAENIIFSEVIMNLPQTAIDFLDVFIGLETRRRKGNKTILSHESDGARNSNGVVGNEESPVISPGNPSANHPDSESTILLPRIHVYAFSTADDVTEDILRRVATVLQCSTDLFTINDAIGTANHTGSSVTLTGSSVTLTNQQGNTLDKSLHTMSGSYSCHNVRDVSPKKQMVCFSFVLPRNVADAEPLSF